jgi:dipeptidyl aminopeptidase/acylaminoacyl peptidase
MSVSPSGVAALFVEQDPSVGTRLWMARAQAPPRVVWSGNAWVGEVRTGRAEHIRYQARDGRALDGWLLYPPGHAQGTPLPIVAQVYPGRVYGGAVPGAFSLLTADFEHPQLFAALGYGVLLPGVPEPENPTPDDQRAALLNGVLPLLDTLVARGIADSARIGVMGQSAGGFGVLALITETTRFRTAIASASYANFESLYGTFYGQSRYGDAGHPLDAQLLRMVQMERGHAALGASPLAAPEAYRRNSPLYRADRVQAPLLLIHGDHDFIPAQQAEEFFTALYRQDKRARFVRYYGEFHTIAARANVLDMWTRIADWLRETLP